MQQQQVEPVVRQPSRGGRDSGESAPAPVRIVPQERMQQVPAEVSPRQQRFEQTPQMDQPRGGRADLPGVPANRIYRDVNPGRADFGRQEQGRSVQGVPVQGNPAQGHPVHGNPDQGRPSQGGPEQGRPDQGRPQR